MLFFGYIILNKIVLLDNTLGCREFHGISFSSLAEKIEQQFRVTRQKVAENLKKVRYWKLFQPRHHKKKALTR